MARVAEMSLQSSRLFTRVHAPPRCKMSSAGRLLPLLDFCPRVAKRHCPIEHQGSWT
jgi:hypothetical protein